MLFTAAQLAALAGREVDTATYEAVHSYVDGLIRGELGALLADPPQPGVIAVAIELARAALPAPGGVQSNTVGPFSWSYPAVRGEVGLSHRQAVRLRHAVGVSAAFSIDTTRPQ